MINVATGTRISLNDLFTHAEGDHRGARSSPCTGRPRAGDVRDSLADITLARDLLGYRPLVGLEEGLRETVAWYASTQQPA